jgi:hypothetical protein
MSRDSRAALRSLDIRSWFVLSVGWHPVSEAVALPFVHVEGGLAPGEAIECPHEAAAIRRAQAMACNRRGGFSRRGDPNVGEFENAVILKAFGEVPDDLLPE